MRQTDSNVLEQETENINSTITKLNSSFTDILSILKSDILIELNQRKSESRENSKLIDLGIQEVNHELKLRISDVRTTIEAMKMAITQSIVRVALGTFASIMFLDYLTPTQTLTQKIESERVE